MVCLCVVVLVGVPESTFSQISNGLLISMYCFCSHTN